MDGNLWTGEERHLLQLHSRQIRVIGPKIIFGNATIPQILANVLAKRILANTRYVGGDMAKVKRQLSLDDVEKGDLTHVETDNDKDFNAVAQILFEYKAGRGVYIC